MGGSVIAAHLYYNGAMRMSTPSDRSHLRLIPSARQREPIVLDAKGYADEQLLLETLVAVVRNILIRRAEAQQPTEKAA